jgi:hypothetical protein
MIVIFVAGDDAIRRFAILRRHCPVYERVTKRLRWVKSEKKDFLLSRPPGSFVGIQFGEDVDAGDGGEISCAQMHDLMQKATSLVDLSRYATERDIEIASASF